MKLADSDFALVGVVETRVSLAPPHAGGGFEYVVRVERTLKGVAAERVTLRSTMTSCKITLAVGQRVGLAYIGEDRQIHSCSYVDPDQLLAAADLPVPTGTPRYAAAIEGVRGLDTVLLGAGGRVAGYEVPRGEVLAQGRCGSRTAVAVRDDEGKILLDSTEVPLREVSAVGCTENGRRAWAVGSDGKQMRLLSVRNGQVEERLRRPADAATIAGSRAYFVHDDLVRIVPFTGARVRSARIAGEFASISAMGNHVAGRLHDGRSAVLDVRTGKLVTRRGGGRLAWLDDRRLLGPDGVYDARLRRLRPVATRGTLVGVVGGSAFFAEGRKLWRLAPGARRTASFGQLPGRVTSVVAAPAARASAARWHSCEESANSPLTT